MHMCMSDDSACTSPPIYCCELNTCLRVRLWSMSFFFSVCCCVLALALFSCWCRSWSTVRYDDDAVFFKETRSASRVVQSGGQLSQKQKQEKTPQKKVVWSIRSFGGCLLVVSHSSASPPPHPHTKQRNKTKALANTHAVVAIGTPLVFPSRRR